MLVVISNYTNKVLIIIINTKYNYVRNKQVSYCWELFFKKKKTVYYNMIYWRSKKSTTKT